MIPAVAIRFPSGWRRVLPSAVFALALGCSCLYGQMRVYDARTIAEPYVDPEQNTWQQIAPDPPKRTDEEIAHIVERLGAISYVERNQAGKEALDAGFVMIPALMEASRSDDPEVRFRSEELLASLSPPRHGTRRHSDLLAQALSGSVADRTEAVKVFMAMDDDVLLDLEAIWIDLIHRANAEQWAFSGHSGDEAQQDLMVLVLEAQLRKGDIRALRRAISLFPYFFRHAGLYDMLQDVLDTKALQVGRYANVQSGHLCHWSNYRTGQSRVHHIWERYYERAASIIRWDTERRKFVLPQNAELQPIPEERQMNLGIRLVDQVLSGDDTDYFSHRNNFFWRSGNTMAFLRFNRNEKNGGYNKREFVIYDFIKKEIVESIPVPSGNFYADPHPIDKRMIFSDLKKVTFSPDDLPVPDMGIWAGHMFARFLPDGRRWVAANHSRLLLLSYPENKVLQEFSYRNGLASDLLISPSGRYVAVPGAHLSMVDLDMGRVAAVDLEDGYNFWPVFLPDETELLVAGFRAPPHLRRFKLPDLRPLASDLPDVGPISHCVLSADGRVMAVHLTSKAPKDIGVVILYDLAEASEIARWPALDVPIDQIRFHPDPERRLLIVAGLSGPIQIWGYHLEPRLPL